MLQATCSFLAVHHDLTTVARMAEGAWLNLDLDDVVVVDAGVRADCSVEFRGCQLLRVVWLLGEIRLICGVHPLRLPIRLACQLCLLHRVSRFTMETQVRRM